MYQSSADMGLAVPRNIALYSLLTCLIAHACGLVPGDFIYTVGDAHICATHVRPLQEQLQILPRPFPILNINTQKRVIDCFVAADFKLVDYDPNQKKEMVLKISLLIAWPVGSIHECHSSETIFLCSVILNNVQKKSPN
ncbi:Bifunctional dihydrofolate reductase-thymidylate synthase [Quillaja saponaria]|uniref:Bifunctional dihydrofolate reductase-thymidylate synthase n=1 Tax=Quillaja saponaria TaxID=32244 RepID=A0AAD7LI43_QUISA|nr:Bifunctional dihydrofolate reductase-thymidylate synthase [Quillaja saponaria]